MIKVLFVCYGSILKYSGKACKINGFMEKEGAYYTILNFSQSLDKIKIAKMNEFTDFGEI